MLENNLGLNLDNRFTASVFSSPDKMKRILEISGVGLWELDLVTKDSFWTKETFRIFGFEPHAGPVPFDSILQAMHPDDLERVQEAVGQATSSRIDVEYRIICKTGDVRYVRAQAAVDSASEPSHIIGTIQDITEQKRTEWQLRSVFQSAKDAFIVIDYENTIVAWNQGAENVFGYTAGERVGSKLSLIIPERFREAHEIGIKRYLSTQKKRLMDRTIELVGLRKDGQEIPIELSLATFGVGENTFFTAIIRDISERKRDQHDLLEIRRLFKLISENSQDIISYSTSDGICRYVSPSIRERLGYEPEEMIGQSNTVYFHPDDIKNINAIGMRILQGGDVERFTCRVLCKNGNYLWFETTLKIIRDDQGNVLQVVGVGRDISEHIEMQESLEHAVRIAGLGHWNCNITDGEIVLSNQMVQILGLENQQEIAVDEFLDKVHPDDVEWVNQNAKKSLQSGAPFDCVFRIVLHDGSIRYLHGQGEVLFDYIGVPLRMIGTSQDITHRKMVELQLQQSKERYQRLVDNSIDAIGIFENGKWVFMNRVGLQMFGATSEHEIVGRNYYDFLHPDHHEECKKRVLAMMAGQPAGITEYKWIKLDGGVFHAEVLGTPYSERAVQIIIRDITERKQSEVIMMNAEKLTAVGELAAGIAHEIRNPLTSLKGFTQILREKSEDDSQKYFEIMRSELSRIEAILNELLVLAKPQAMHVKPMEIGLLLREVVDLLQAQAFINNVLVETCMEEAVPLVECDPNQLKQVFINIVKNAIEAMPQGGNVVIKLTSVEDGVCIECADSGQGIPIDRLDKMGTPFFSTKENGTGLGFMVSRNIIESRKGNIHIDSKLGQGTAIRIILPSYKKDDS